MTTYVQGGPPRYAHQMRGLHKMIGTGGVTALLFDPGMGKTAVVVDYAGLLALKSTTGEARVLVVAPLAAVDTWVSQVELFSSPMVSYWAEALGGGILDKAEALASRGGSPFPKPLVTPPKRGRRHAPRAAHFDQAIAWAAHGIPNGRVAPYTPSEGPGALPNPRVVLEVINIDTLASRQPFVDPTTGKTTSRLLADIMLAAIRRFEPDLLVVDESHKIKSAKGNASRLLSRISRYVRRRMILTGTVMPHSPLDVFGQWRFLDPYAFGTTQGDGTLRQSTYGDFADRFAVMGGYYSKEVTGYKNLDDMQRIMARHAIVARKSEALDLPPIVEVTIPVHLSPRESKAYKEMKDVLQAALASGELATAPNRLAQMMRLRQITSGHLTTDTGAVRVIGDSKAQVIRSIVHDTLAGEKRVVVFALFVPEITALSKILQEKGTRVVTITGATPPESRLRLRQEFKDTAGHPGRIVMVAQVRTMSLAVNELVSASHAVFGSLSQQRDDLIQARDRLHRIGQEGVKVTFWYALAPGTVDEVIMKSHKERTDLENAMLAHIRGEE